MTVSLTELQARLAEPFEAAEVKWKAQAVRGNRALAVAYVDARVVEDRLDAVFGVDGWQDSYRELPSKSVVCTLRVRIGQEWISHEDVGSTSDQPDEGDRTKSAFSDALKRAAVKLGIGRYLYRLPHQWVDYDPQGKKLAKTPQLPPWACPKGKGPSPAAQGEQQPRRITREQWEQIKTDLVRHQVSQRKFLEHLEVQKPGDIPVARVQEALTLARSPSPEMTGKPALDPKLPRQLKTQPDPELQQPDPNEPPSRKEVRDLESLLVSRGDNYAATMLQLLGVRDLSHIPLCWVEGIRELCRRFMGAEQLAAWRAHQLNGQAINDLPQEEVQAAWRRGLAASK